MNYNLFTIYDKKVKSFMPIFVASNVDEAIRIFTNMCNYSNSLLTKFPSDYALYQIIKFESYFSAESMAQYLENDSISFVADGLSVKKEDTNKYDELINMLNQQKVDVGVALSSYNDEKNKLEKTVERLNGLYSRTQILADQITQLSDIVENIDKDNSKFNRQSFFDRLFG